jgi:hypothetical protein
MSIDDEIPEEENIDVPISLGIIIQAPLAA